jgi:glycosyltransferase involved in cell wall biosynthesis
VTAPRVLISASNLHVGGGVQVAASFVNELAAMRSDGSAPSWLADSRIEVSSEVAVNLDPTTAASLPVKVIDTRPWSVPRWRLGQEKFDVSFAVFGPEYGWRRATRRIMGYADVTAVIPNPRGVVLPPKLRAKRALRARLSRQMARTADRLVVESTAFADAVRRAIPGLEAPIDVVPNCVSTAVLRAGAVGPPPGGHRPVRLLYVGRGYPHKNHEFLAALGSELGRLGHDVVFRVTLTEEEWRARSDEFRRRAKNLGLIKIEGLPAAHADVDAVIFPSLLEAFSATPLEGMALGRTVFAADRDFVRSVCGDGPEYFDPLDARATAAIVEAWLADRDRVDQRASEASHAVRNGLPGPRDRAEAYCDLIDWELLQ